MLGSLHDICNVMGLETKPCGRVGIRTEDSPGSLPCMPQARPDWLRLLALHWRSTEIPTYCVGIQGGPPLTIAKGLITKFGILLTQFRVLITLLLTRGPSLYLNPNNFGGPYPRSVEGAACEPNLNSPDREHCRREALNPKP